MTNGITATMSPDAITIDRGEITAWGIRLLCQVRGEPALTTGEVASIGNIPRAAAVDQLEALETQGLVGSKVSEDGQQWWFVVGGRGPTRPQQPRASPPR